MTPTFQSPSSFDPSYSLLGRAFRYGTGDRLRGEALYIVALTGLAVVLLMTHYLGWALLQPILTQNPSWQMLFWAGQLASGVVWGIVGLVGIRPSVTVSCNTSTVRFHQGGRTYTVPYDGLDRVASISATTYHRHYRRYAATKVFVSQVPDELLLLRTPHGPVVVGLPDADDREALRHHLETATIEAPEAAVSHA